MAGSDGGACPVAYALRPVPDVIPVIGYADDLVPAPVAIVLAVRLAPAAVTAELPRSWASAVSVVLVWLLAGLVPAGAYSGRSEMSVGW